MIVGAGHGIARSDSFRVAIERCRDHYFYERCPERYQLMVMPKQVVSRPLKQVLDLTVQLAEAGLSCRICSQAR